MEDRAWLLVPFWAGLGRVALREERQLLAEWWTKQAFQRSPTQTGACASMLRNSQPALEGWVRPLKCWALWRRCPGVDDAGEQKDEASDLLVAGSRCRCWSGRTSSGQRYHHLELRRCPFLWAPPPLKNLLFLCLPCSAQQQRASWWLWATAGVFSGLAELFCLLASH